jgi:hypothetical protein
MTIPMYTIRMRRVRDGEERDVPLDWPEWDAEMIDYLLTDGALDYLLCDGDYGDPNNRAVLFGDELAEPLDDDARDYVIVRVVRRDGVVVMEGDPTVAD